MLRTACSSPVAAPSADLPSAAPPASQLEPIRPEDAELLSICLDRSSQHGARRERAWERFLALHESTLQRILRRAWRRRGVQPTRETLEDGRQTLLLHLISRGRAAGLDDAERWAYLVTVVDNLVRDALRRAAAKKRRIDGGTDDPVDVWAPAWLGGPANPRGDLSDDPLRRAVLAEARHTFRAQCHCLAPDPAAARTLELVFLEGATSREASEAVGGAVEPRAVDRLVMRVRRHYAALGVMLPRR
ncbi:MAG: hypothetical protein AAGN46_07565 [Acidobacteriota bacterium]